MAILKQCRMECVDGSHNKEYRLELHDRGAGTYEVIGFWGKIGSSLSKGCKFSGELAGAEKEYAKIFREKTGKGYQVTEIEDDGQTGDTPLPAPAPQRQVIVRVAPMLCGAILEMSECEKYITDDNYVLEEKFNGERKHVIKHEQELSLAQKAGLESAKGVLPKIKDEFLSSPDNFTLDIEDQPLNQKYCVILDIITLNGKPVDKLTLEERGKILEDWYDKATFDKKIIRLRRQVRGTEAKRAFIQELIDIGAEGFIIKNLHTQYVGGDAGRKYQFKFKFQATASFIVQQQNGTKSSVFVYLLDGLRRVQCGACTIPVNKKIPKDGAIIEIEYLYAERGSNKLVQAKYKGERSDVTSKECQVSQLKYKQEATE